MVSFNESVDFLAQVAFPAFRRDAKGLSYFRRLRNSQHLLWQMLLKHPRRPEFVPLAQDIGIPENTQAALAKISIRSKTSRFIS